MRRYVAPLAVLAALFMISVVANSAVQAQAATGAGGCAATTAADARWLADELFRQGEYRSAAACYESAGDFTHANESYVRAARAQGEASAREAQNQGTAAKALLTQVQQAFRPGH